MPKIRNHSLVCGELLRVGNRATKVAYRQRNIKVL
nr:MAG TPA: hypothetical protein [Caudoviricetes sp.]